MSSQLDLSTERLQRAQTDEVHQKQLQMRIEELQTDLERLEREDSEKVSIHSSSLVLNGPFTEQSSLPLQPTGTTHPGREKPG